MATSLISKSSPTEIYIALDRVFSGQPWLTYEPETILNELKHDIADADQDKILAVQSLAANSSAVLSNAVAFEKIVLAFCNNICVMDTWQPTYVEEIYYAMKHMLSIIKRVHGSTSKIKFYGEIPGYVAAIAKYRGWFVLPKLLSFAQERLNYLTGLTEDSTKYKENERMINVVTKLYNELDEPNAKNLLDKIGTQYSGNDSMAVSMKNIVGALLYDPTLVD